jgi:hypothetical protein
MPASPTEAELLEDLLLEVGQWLTVMPLGAELREEVILAAAANAEASGRLDMAATVRMQLGVQRLQGARRRVSIIAGIAELPLELGETVSQPDPARW